MCAFLRLRKKKQQKNKTVRAAKDGEGVDRALRVSPAVASSSRKSSWMKELFTPRRWPITSLLSAVHLTRHSRGAPTPHTSHSGVMLGWAHGKTTHAAGKSRSLCRRSHGRGPAAEAEAKKKAKLAVTFIRELEHFSPHPNTCKRKRRTFFC